MSFLCCYHGDILANGNMPEGEIDSVADDRIVEILLFFYRLIFG